MAGRRLSVMPAELQEQLQLPLETNGSIAAEEAKAIYQRMLPELRTIRFTVFGDPVAQGRARITTINGYPRAYDPAKSAHYKEYVRSEAVKVKPDVPLEGALSLTVLVYRAIPKALQTKVKLPLVLAGKIRPVTKPDLKNVLAGVEDALKGIIWRDDSQVVDFGDSGKWYSQTPRVEVVVREVVPDAVPGGAG